MVNPGRAPWTHRIDFDFDLPDQPNIDPDELKALVNSALPGPNFVQKSVLVDTSLNFDSWMKYAHVFSDEDPSLLDQILYGFPTGASHPENILVPFTNHASARRNPQIVQDYINKHLQTHAVYGPFEVNPLDQRVIVSPLQVAFSNAGKPRVCNDLSFSDCSVNSCISDEWNEFPGYSGDLELPSIDDLVQAILDRGKGCLLWKTDFSAYYKQLNSDPGDLPLLSFAYAGKLYFEARLPFGLRSSCLNAQRVTKAVIKIFRSISRAFCAGYIDDVVAVSLAIAAAEDYDSFILLCEELGLGLTLPKCVCPCFSLVWIGIEADTQEMKLSLPPDKLSRILDMLRQWLLKKSAAKRDLQVLLGVMNHVASILIVCRAFTGFVIDLLRADKFPVVLTVELFKDVQIWIDMLCSDIVSGNTMKSPLLIPCDHIVQVAFAGYFFAVSILGEVHMFHIKDEVDLWSKVAYVYAFWQASILAAHRFPGTWLTCTVLTHSDVLVVNRAKNVIPELRPMVRHTWCLQAQFDMCIRAKKGMCCREIDSLVAEATHAQEVSINDVPDKYFV